jgi:hypothetical protein
MAVQSYIDVNILRENWTRRTGAASAANVLSTPQPSGVHARGAPLQAGGLP